MVHCCMSHCAGRIGRIVGSLESLVVYLQVKGGDQLLWVGA